MLDCAFKKCFFILSQCICPFNANGQFCETSIEIQAAAFSGHSFLTHEIVDDTSSAAGDDDAHVMRISVQIKTFSSNGLILLASAMDAAAEEEESSLDSISSSSHHYLALFSQRGFLQFQFSCGVQTMLLSELETQINTGNEMAILLK